MGKQLDPNPGHGLRQALLTTARRLQEGAPYRWTHQGMCNCGHLAQTVTRLDRAAIHAMALEKAGEWADHAVEYCPESGFPIDDIITGLIGLGLSPGELVHLERLSDPRVLRRLPGGKRYLDKGSRDDVVLYMETWAQLLSL